MALSYDSTEVLAGFARGSNITFPLLADPGSKTIDAYGIRDAEGNGYPLPGTFLVDRDGVIRAKLFEDGFRTRHSADALIEAARGLK